MPRKARIVLPNNPHHVTQRGNRSQTVFFSDEDRCFYLELMEFYTRKFETYVLSYCLMNNHVHHLLVPTSGDGLRRSLQAVHMHYAQMINQRMGWTGHLWQQRFYSCPIRDDYFWIALRYVERNPVEAGMVLHPSEYAWSSAGAHCELRKDSLLYYTERWAELLRSIENWFEWLATGDPDRHIQLLRDATRRGRLCEHS